MKPPSPAQTAELAQAHAGRGRAFDALGREHDALAAYARSVELDPTDADVFCDVGRLMLRLGRAGNALAAFGAALQLKPDCVAAIAGQALARRSMTGATPEPPSAASLGADATFARAHELHQHGRLDEAAGLYREVLVRGAHTAPALHYLGVIELQSGRPAVALEWITAALAIENHIAAMHVNHAAVLSALGRRDEALVSYERAIALDPGAAGTVLEYAALLQSVGRNEEALAAVDRALALAPGLSGTQVNRGLILVAMRRFDAALRAFENAIEIEPGCLPAHVNRAGVLCELGRPTEALGACDAALAVTPDFAPALSNRAMALNDLERPVEALASSDRALALAPDFEQAHGNRAKSLEMLDRSDEALLAYGRVTALRPDAAQAWVNASHTLLRLGRFSAGWASAEWRKRLPVPHGRRALGQPVWDGHVSLSGKTVLIYWEQGLGDTLQFCRYALQAHAHGARVVMAVQRSLVRLVRTLSADIAVVTDSQIPAHLDYHCALLSLPLACGTTLDSIPADVPYLAAEPERIARWRRRIGTAGFKIGIGWQGNPLSKVDLGRSFPVRALENLARLDGVRLISLQRNAGIEQLRNLPAGMTVEQWEDLDVGPDAFVDSAAVMNCVDLVITSDTALAHLAGALARPAWVGLQHVADWRWLRDRADSPWYPTLRLFRQPKRGDWGGVFEAMHAALSALLRAQPTS